MEGFAGPFQITQEDKKKILGENWAEAHGFDIDELKATMKDDEYSNIEMADKWQSTGFEVAN